MPADHAEGARFFAADLFGRHLDLTPLGQHRRGLVRCRFHHDPEPSLSVDLDAGVFHCFGCGVEGGVLRFAELVGEAASPAPLVEDLHAIALRLAKRQRWARPGVLDAYAAADQRRADFAAVRFLRQCATAMGDSPEAWELLSLAADVERDLLADP